MQTLTEKSFEKFKSENKTYCDMDVNRLEDALKNWTTYSPGPDIRHHLDTHPNEPLQVVRDRLIVDYMIERGGLALEKAAKLWSDWEDYEYEMRCES